ncbi:MAG: F0F1 ATP synthase subunit delta [Lachnospiraceae bacterium]|nr:F0F1 ATP synthase subunit delta [Lachnospiraceae bacterium]
MAKLISKTYGDALFELAMEQNEADAFLEEVTSLRQILEENGEFDKLMNHPKIRKEEKQRVMEEVFRGRISEQLLGFLILILQKERYRDLDQIFMYFTDKIKDARGIGVAYVATAMELSEVQKKRIEEKLLQTTSYRQMEMHYRTDAGLIGGMVIRIGDRVVDSSVRTKLEELKRQLYQIQLQS